VKVTSSTLQKREPQITRQARRDPLLPSQRRVLWAKPPSMPPKNARAGITMDQFRNHQEMIEGERMSDEAPVETGKNLKSLGAFPRGI
jgi:hypothetical protein